MKVASPDEAAQLAVELIEMAILPTGGLFLERRRERSMEALEAVAGVWERLPDTARDLARSVGATRWPAAIDSVLREPDDADEARSAALLAADLAEPDLAASLVAGLRLDDDRSRASCELALLGLSLRARAAAPPLIAPEVEGPNLRALAGPAVEAVERATLDVHLADAAWAFATHQRRLGLLAGLAALDLRGLSEARRDQSSASGAARLLRLVQESSHVAHRAMRQILRWSPAPLVRERALLLLAEPAIAEAALERLSRAESAPEHAAVLERAHLALRPARRRLLKMLRITATSPAAAAASPKLLDTPTEAPPGQIAPGQAIPDRAAWESLIPAARRGAVGLIGLVDADDQARAAGLHEALADPDPLVRMRALSMLPRAELASFCFDADERIARSAMLRWSTAGLGLRARAEPGERLRLATLLLRSPHASVRRLAAQDVARETVWDVSAPASRAGAWRLAIRERDSLLSKLRSQVQAARPEAALPETQSSSPAADTIARAIAAISTARTLGLVRVLAADLAELVDPARAGVDARLAATAAAALGDVDDALSREALRRALTHPDARVRANAVESIGDQRLSVEDATTGRDRDYGVLIELKADANHRVRANAIRALLHAPPACPKERRPLRKARGAIEEKPRIYEPAAVEALAQMLGDSRPAHRLAGAWLAGRVLGEGRCRVGDAWSGLSSRLSEMAASDSDTDVRARARHAASRLAAGVRAAWGGNASTLQSDAIGTLIGPPHGGAAPTGHTLESDGTFAVAPAEPARIGG